jgi:hypothetical protein
MDDRIIISGKTYPYKESIRSLGGRFQGGDKVWHLPVSDDVLTQVESLCKSVGGGALPAPQVAKSREPIEPDPLFAPSTPSAAVDQPLVAMETTNVTIMTETQTAFIEPALDGLTISQLMAKAQLAMTSAFPRAVWVLGEIQNLNTRKTACYFQLAEPKEGASDTATTTVNATIWQSNFNTIKAKHGQEAMSAMLQDGLKVRMLCSVGLYKDRGHVTLTVLDIDPSYTKGALALAREKLLKELRAKGLHDANKRQVLTPFPLRVGLISAEGSRAKSDFLDQLTCYGFPGQVIFYPAQMQGEALLKEVVAGLTALGEMALDVIVVTRVWAAAHGNCRHRSFSVARYKNRPDSRRKILALRTFLSCPWPGGARSRSVQILIRAKLSQSPNGSAGDLRIPDSHRTYLWYALDNF